MSFCTRNRRTVFLQTSSIMACPCFKESAWGPGNFNSFSLKKCNYLTPPFSLSLGRETAEIGLQENGVLLLSTHSLRMRMENLACLNYIEWKGIATSIISWILCCQILEKWVTEARVVFGETWSWIQSVYSPPCPFQSTSSTGQGRL